MYKNFRNENKPTVQRMLSDEAKSNRSRRNRISLQMNVLSWLLEFISGILVAIDYLFAISDSNFYYWMYWFTALDVFLCGVLVPCAYVLKTDEIKEFVYTMGLMMTFNRVFFGSSI